MNTPRPLLTLTSRQTLVVFALITLAMLALCMSASAQQRASSRRSSGRTSTETRETPTRETSSRETATTSTAPVAARLSYGPLAGLTYTRASAENESFDGIGYHLGGIVSVPLAPRVAATGRLVYESKSFSATVTDGSTTVSMGTKVNHLELAGGIRYDVSPSVLVEGGLSLQLDAGGHSTWMTRTAAGRSETSPLRSSHELTNPTQVALTAGAGYRIPVASGMELIPTATVNVYLTSPGRDGGSWNTLRLGAQLMFN